LQRSQYAPIGEQPAIIESAAKEYSKREFAYRLKKKYCELALSEWNEQELSNIATDK
jgi:hypothetical protein